MACGSMGSDRGSDRHADQVDVARCHPLKLFSFALKRAALINSPASSAAPRPDKCVDVRAWAPLNTKCFILFYLVHHDLEAPMSKRATSTRLCRSQAGALAAWSSSSSPSDSATEAASSSASGRASRAKATSGIGMTAKCQLATSVHTTRLKQPPSPKRVDTKCHLAYAICSVRTNQGTLPRGG